MKIKKTELIIVISILVIGVLGFVGYRSAVANKANKPSDQNQSNIQFNRPETGTPVYELLINQEDADIQVIHGDSVVMLLNSEIDGFYEVEGDYGMMHVEVKDGSWRVTEEECPNHICSSVGFVSLDDYFPILCIPNNIAVYAIEA